MRRPIRKRDLLRRIEALEAALAQPTPAPMDGQQAINVGTIAHHAYEGPGACRADLFGTRCGAHRDEHRLVDEDGRS
ncbi:hypothetical protein [Streptomyces glaucescens]|uniref:hypothetical protein n=1 Tax=Streptomyces glaucescens TaxID=1907 RepID=UPI000A35E099|nr:hypothetical protein [Streptomyces glaucescens]